MSTIDSQDNILIVDDTPTNLEVLMELLNEAGYKVRTANDGKMALQCVHSKLPALILLDVMMPDMDGYEVCRIIKEEKKTSSIPIIFISALEDEHRKVKGFQAGGVDYITKPFYSEEVLARVKAHLNLRRMQLDLEERNTTLTMEIKERKRMEEKNMQLVSIIESSDDAIIGNTLDGIITSWNTGAEKMYGYSKEEAIGQSTFIIIPHNHQGEMLQFVNKVREGHHLHYYETESRKKDGKQINISVSISPIYASDGTLIGVSTIARDVTDHKKTEVEREKLISELQEALNEVKTLSGLIPICASCKKIRDDKGYWNTLEAYIMQHSDAHFTHGVCPDCMAKLYPKYVNPSQSDKKK